MADDSTLYQKKIFFLNLTSLSICDWLKCNCFHLFKLNSKNKEIALHFFFKWNELALQISFSTKIYRHINLFSCEYTNDDDDAAEKLYARWRYWKSQMTKFDALIALSWLRTLFHSWISCTNNEKKNLTFSTN